ncbi:MAG: hypothetical protein HY787_06715 [Deltaproteobacteria bacterium]|nr:hypothetical protein [Deltaproteobacteria bacterium]
MLRYKDVTDGGVTLEQLTSRPTLYLDQWMWCLLSEDSALRNKFIKTAGEANATVMYSNATLIELALIEDEKQIDAIHEVMDNLDYGFSDSNPSRVIEKEERLEIPGGGAFYDSNPCCDLGLISNYFLYRMDPLKPFQLSAILPKLKGDVESGKFRDMGRRFEDLTPIVLNARKDPQSLSKAKRRHSKRELSKTQMPYTKDIYRLAIDFVVVNQNMKMSSSEWIDLLHTVVPVAYFDLVMLDKRWCHFIRTIFPLSPPNIAHVFSQRGIGKFLKAIEEFAEEKPE